MHVCGACLWFRRCHDEASGLPPKRFIEHHIGGNDHTQLNSAQPFPIHPNPTQPNPITHFNGLN